MNNFIDYIVKQESDKTVGVLLKRIEILVAIAKNENRKHVSFEELEILKAEQRELVHEAYRNIRDFLKAEKMKIEFKE